MQEVNHAIASLRRSPGIHTLDFDETGNLLKDFNHTTGVNFVCTAPASGTGSVLLPADDFTVRT